MEEKKKFWVEAVRVTRHGNQTRNIHAKGEPARITNEYDSFESEEAFSTIREAETYAYLKWAGLSSYDQWHTIMNVITYHNDEHEDCEIVASHDYWVEESETWFNDRSTELEDD